MRSDDLFHELMDKLNRAYDEIDEVLSEMRYMGMREEAAQIERNAAKAFEQANALLDEHVGEA